MCRPARGGAARGVRRHAVGSGLRRRADTTQKLEPRTSQGAELVICDTVGTPHEALAHARELLKVGN